MKGSHNRYQQRRVAASMVSTMDLYEQALTTLVSATGDRKSYGRPQKDLIVRLQPNQVAAVRCADSENYYRTVMIKANPLTNGFRTLVSNPVYGEIPDGLMEITAENLLKQMRDMNSVLSYNDFKAFPYSGLGGEI